jgi:hypothetical protein
MANAVYGPDGYLDLLADSIAGHLATVDFHLIKANVGLAPWPGNAALIAAEADYTGYAAGVVTWGTPSKADDGTYEIVGTVPTFRPAGVVIVNNVWGGYLQQHAAPLHIPFAVIFDNAPLPMDDVLQTIDVVLRYRPQTQTIIISIS